MKFPVIILRITWKLEHIAELQEILNRIMQGIVSIIIILGLGLLKVQLLSNCQFNTNSCNVFKDIRFHFYSLNPQSNITHIHDNTY